MSIESAVANAQKIDNRLILDDELQWLADQASKHSFIVNVGSWTGCSARVMAESTQGLVFAVDPWDFTCGGFFGDDFGKGKPPGWMYDVFLKNMEPLTNVVTLRTLSVVAADVLRGNKIDMVFIDANHEYPFIKADIEAWKPLLVPGGLLCGHDYVQAGWGLGVIQAVDELLPGCQFGPSTLWHILT